MPRREITQEERKARRHARNAMYWKRHKDRLLAKQREHRKSNPELVEKDRARSRSYYHAHKEERAAYHRRWRAMHRDHLHAYYVATFDNPERVENRRRNIKRRKERLNSDPEYRAHLNELNRLLNRKRRKQPKYASFKYRTYYVPKWTEVVAGGPKRIQRYLRKARPESRRLFMIWYTNHKNLLDRTTGLGHIEQERDGFVESV